MKYKDVVQCCYEETMIALETLQSLATLMENDYETVEGLSVSFAIESALHSLED